jgi:hypothetical protein
MRPNRVQPQICSQVLLSALDKDTVHTILRESGVAQLPHQLPSAPRDLAALARELQPFVALYRALQNHTNPDTALALIRQCIIQSGLASHAADQDSSNHPSPLSNPQPLNLTSPPLPGFAMSDKDLQAGFALAMAHFSCEGQLIEYTPQRVQFHITGCNWCTAMHNAGAPELIPFICETDERFMDNHPTHRLRRPTAIGLGQTHCDFQFVPIDSLS